MARRVGTEQVSPNKQVPGAPENTRGAGWSQRQELAPRTIPPGKITESGSLHPWKLETGDV